MVERQLASANGSRRGSGERGSANQFDTPRRLRCAVYTRKSSDEGLEQSFNSLHAQRDACEAYIASQKHEGWVLVPDSYDDGGLSGGSMERPALKRLLADIEACRVDLVIVYKVDRLTRSLADFARLTDLFDRHGASFVSVTQQFNTSTSMGRLTLNVLLSFAQFEREVASERIRDKIALSKRRGMWMGGLPPLGYDGVDKKLVVNQAEAESVRTIYRAYLRLGSIFELKLHVDALGIRSKVRNWSDGRTGGNAHISRGALYQILRNRLYIGEIAHRGDIHKAIHEPIIERELWDAVQHKLEDQAARPRERDGRRRTITTRSTSQPWASAADRDGTKSMETTSRTGPSRGNRSAKLVGIIFDGDGNRMTPSYTRKSGRRYCYYVSAPLVRGKRVRASTGIRVPAADIEALVQAEIANLLRDENWLSTELGAGLDVHETASLLEAGRAVASRIDVGSTGHSEAGPAGSEDSLPPARLSPSILLSQLVCRVEVGHRKLCLTLDGQKLALVLEESRPGLTLIVREPKLVQRTIPAQALRCGKQVRLVIGKVDSEVRQPDADLVTLIATARRWFEELRTGKRDSLASIARAEQLDQAEVSRSITLAFLAPEIVEMILRGEQPNWLTLERLRAARPLATAWEAQLKAVSITGSSDRSSERLSPGQ